MGKLTLARVSRAVRLCTDEGIDLPKAAVVSEIAKCCSCEIYITCADHHAKARNVSKLLGLMAEPGCDVVLEAEGFGSEEALNLVANLLVHPF